MVFGRKSKQTEAGDLHLAYGNHDVADDESSVGASVPPPPPNGQDGYNNYHDQMFQDETAEDRDASRGGYSDEERAASIEAQDVGVSMLSESSDYSSRRDPSRRKKALVIMTCLVTFCALLGVAVAYGRKDSGTTQSSSFSSLETEDSTVPSNSSSLNGTFVDDNMTMPETPLNETDLEPVSETPLNETVVEPVEDTPLNETAQATETMEPTEDPSTDDPEASEGPAATPDPSTGDPEASEGPAATPDPSTDDPEASEGPAATPDPSTDDPEASEGPAATPDPTAEELETGDPTGTQDPTGTLGPTGTLDPTGTDSPTENLEFPECIFNQVSADVTCADDGSSVVTVFVCKPGEATDEFWAWESTPVEYQSAAQNDWNWLGSTGTIEIVRNNLPKGPYTFGLYGQGRENLVEYPLLASANFTIGC
jgi:hypothetical protein